MVSDEDAAGLADELYDAIGLLRRRSRRLVGAPQPELLRVLRRNPGITVTEAAHLLGLAANTVSTLVSQLLPLGVLVRERDATDRRVARLDLTPSAREGLEQWRDRRTQATATVLARLPAGERARLSEALATIARIAADLPESSAAPASPVPSGGRP